MESTPSSSPMFVTDATISPEAVIIEEEEFTGPCFDIQVKKQ